MLVKQGENFTKKNKFDLLTLNIYSRIRL